jgi:phage-related protein
MSGPGQYSRQWRYYKTASGNSPVKADVLDLPREDRAEVVAAMRLVLNYGVETAKKARLVQQLTGDILELRVDARDQTYRLLFAEEGYYGQVLLGLDMFSKKTQKVPRDKIKLAEDRLRDWRERGARQQRMRRPGE